MNSQSLNVHSHYFLLLVKILGACLRHVGGNIKDCQPENNCLLLVSEKYHPHHTLLGKRGISNASKQFVKFILHITNKSCIYSLR